MTLPIRESPQDSTGVAFVRRPVRIQPVEPALHER